jgi:hypothetical protein
MNITVELRDFTGSVVAILPTAFDVQWLDELEGAGSGSFRLPASDSPGSAYGDPLVAGMRAIIRVDGVVRGGFVIDSVSLTTISSGEDADRIYDVTGAGLLTVLGEAIVYTGGTPDGSDPEQRTLAGTMGEILEDLVTEAQARDALADLTLGFNATDDSNGDAWGDEVELVVPEGVGYDQVLQRLQQLGQLEVWMDGLTLHAAPTRGTDLSDTIRLLPARDLGAATLSLAGPVRNAVLYRTNAGLSDIEYIPTVATLGRRETFVNLRQLRDAGSITRAVSRTLDDFAQPQLSLTAEVVSGAWPAWGVGDTITVPIDVDGVAIRRVTALSVQQNIAGELLFVPTLGRERPSLEQQLLDSMTDWNSTSRPGNRAATLVVAASNSTADGCAAADLVCTGTDDQTTINLAIDSCTALPNGGRVLLLEGTYNLTAPVVLKSRVELVGVGEGTILYPANANLVAISVVGPNAAVRDMWLLGQSGLSGFSGVGISGAPWLKVDGVTIWQFTTGITTGEYSRVSECVLDSCNTGVSAGGGGVAGTATTINRCSIFTRAGGTGIRTQSGTQITNCMVGGGAIGVEVTNPRSSYHGTGGQISGSFFTQQTSAGILVATDSNQWVISGNTLHDVGTTSAGTAAGIWLRDRADNSVVIGNSIVGWTRYLEHGIRISPQTMNPALYTQVLWFTNQNVALLDNAILASNITGASISDGGTNTVVRGMNIDLPATQVSVVPNGDITATDAQAALEELDAEKLALAGGTMTGNLVLDDGVDIDVGSTIGTVIGDAAALLAFFGAAPVPQPLPVDDPTGGTTVDTEARAAIVAIRDALATLGLIQPPGS